MEEVKCPYCLQYVEIDTSEHYEGTEVYSCPVCAKNFEVLAQLTMNYTAAKKADCLNGSEHKWKQQAGTPTIYFKGKYVCETCSAEKTVSDELATKEEWLKYFSETEM